MCADSVDDKQGRPGRAMRIQGVRGYQLSFGGEQQVWDITLKMLGPADSPCVAGKGSETHGLLPWVVEMFKNNIAKIRELPSDLPLEGQLLWAAGKAAVRFDTVLRASTRRISEDKTEQLMSDYLQFASLIERANGNMVQKHHLMVHCVQNTRFQGNPRMYTTYRSESFNGVLARIARACHRRNWYRDILYHVSILNALELNQMMNP